MIDAVDQETARRLKALGYPQDYPNEDYLAWRHHGVLALCSGFSISTVVAAAPSVLQALDWLEREKGWWYRRFIGRWVAAHGTGRALVTLPAMPETPGELLRLLLEKLEEANNG